MKAPVLLVSHFNFPKTQGEKSLANTTRVDVSGHQSSVTLCKNNNYLQKTYFQISTVLETLMKRGQNPNSKYE